MIKPDDQTYCMISLIIRFTALNGRTVSALVYWSMVPGSSHSLGKTPTLKTVMEFSDLHEKLSCIITAGNMSLLNCDIYQRGRVSRVADTKLVHFITYLIRPPGSILGVG